MFHRKLPSAVVARRDAPLVRVRVSLCVDFIIALQFGSRLLAIRGLVRNVPFDELILNHSFFRIVRR